MFRKHPVTLVHVRLDLHRLHIQGFLSFGGRSRTEADLSVVVDGRLDLLLVPVDDFGGHPVGSSDQVLEIFLGQFVLMSSESEVAQLDFSLFPEQNVRALRVISREEYTTKTHKNITLMSL